MKTYIILCFDGSAFIALFVNDRLGAFLNYSQIHDDDCRHLHVLFYGCEFISDSMKHDIAVKMGKGGIPKEFYSDEYKWFDMTDTKHFVKPRKVKS